MMLPPPKRAFLTLRMIGPVWSKESSTRHPFWSLGGDRNCPPVEGAARKPQSQNRRPCSDSSDDSGFHDSLHKRHMSWIYGKSEFVRFGPLRRKEETLP